MSEFGTISYDSQGYVNMHSSYSSLVWGGSMTQVGEPVTYVNTGTDLFTPSEARQSSHYRLGKIVVFEVDKDFSFIMPFYRVFSNTIVCIVDMIKEDNKWRVTLAYKGSDVPEMYYFYPMNEDKTKITDTHGCIVYNKDGVETFRSDKIPLRVDWTKTIQLPETISSGNTFTGTCGTERTGNNNGDHSANTTCDVMFTASEGKKEILDSYDGGELYHAIPAGYGELYYEKKHSYETDEGLLEVRKHAQVYASWVKVRSALEHVSELNHAPKDGEESETEDAYIVPTWIGVCCGKFFKHSDSVSIGGVVGALVDGINSITPLDIFQGSDPSVSVLKESHVVDNKIPFTLIKTTLEYYT